MVSSLAQVHAEASKFTQERDSRFAIKSVSGSFEEEANKAGYFKLKNDLLEFQGEPVKRFNEDANSFSPPHLHAINAQDRQRPQLFSQD